MNVEAQAPRRWQGQVRPIVLSGIIIVVFSLLLDQLSADFGVPGRSFVRPLTWGIMFGLVFVGAKYRTVRTDLGIIAVGLLALAVEAFFTRA